MAYGGPSGEFSLDFVLAMSALSTAETDEEVDEAVEKLDEAVEQSTLAYQASFLDLSDTEISMHISLEESNVFIGQDLLEELAEEILDTLYDKTVDKLTTMAATDDLMGSQAIIFERIHGYHTAQDLFDAAGVGWGGSFQVEVEEADGKGRWNILHRYHTD